MNQSVASSGDSELGDCVGIYRYIEVYTGVVDFPHIYVDCGRKGVPSDCLDVKGKKKHDYGNNCRMNIFIICASKR